MGGMASISLSFHVKWSCRTSLTFVHVLVLSYMIATYRLIGIASETADTDGALLKPWKIGVICLNMFHASQAVFLPLRAKKDVWSDPVKEWKARSACDFS